MADIIPFQKLSSKKNVPKKKGSQKVVSKKIDVETNTATKPVGGHTLCKSGFHKWKADKSTDFSVKQGKLLTRYVCERCGKTKTQST